MNKRSITTKDLILMAMFSALTAVLSQILLPIPFSPIPINLATLSVFLAGACLGGKKGAISQLIYLLLGAAGLPVFTGMGSGIGIIAGPTGGYIIGYIVAAYLTGLICFKFPKTYINTAIAMLTGLLFCYFFGTLWYMFLTKVNFTSALAMCVIPFLPGDFIKIAAACLVVKRLRKAIHF